MVRREKSYGRRHRCTDKIGMGLSIVAVRRMDNGNPDKNIANTCVVRII